MQTISQEGNVST